MNKDCQLVVFSDKAYNAIIRETFEWEPVETGGILLGHVLDNGCWIVMEVLPPGYGEGREGNNVYHESGYFEYNQKFVNYLAKSVAEQYEIPLELLGLWHRHPGSMDHFSGTDDVTNSTFAAQNSHGVISGLINVDPQLRMTMYYLAHSNARNFGRPNYQKVDIEVGSDLIPDEYFKLRYYQGTEHDLHPYAPQKAGCYNGNSQQAHIDIVQEPQSSDGQSLNGENIIKDQIKRNSKEGFQQDKINETQNEPMLSVVEDVIENIKKNKLAIILFLAIIAFFFSLFSIKNDFSKGFHFFNEEKKQNKNVNATQNTDCDANINTKESSVTSKDGENVVEQGANESAIRATSTKYENEKSATETGNSDETSKTSIQPTNKK